MGILNESLGIAGHEGNYQRSFDLWSGFNLGELLVNPGLGTYLQERFANCPLFATGVSQNGNITYQDASATIQGIATVLGGAQRFATPATDNKEAHLQCGANVGAPFKIDSSAFRDLGYEACFRVNQLAETALYTGLGGVGFAAENALVDDTGALASNSFLGFHIPAHASEAKVDFVYRKAGQAMQTIAADVHTCVAGTFLTAGFKLDRDSKKIYGYINGVEVGTLKYRDWGTGLFPDAVFLNSCRGIKSGEGVAKTADFLWVDSAQYR